ncbi:MAG: potassium channel family protein [Terrimicrobiaceae bacterium]|nr:potassium channel family protein [Terrimicrobiaceae bacterium]
MLGNAPSKNVRRIATQILIGVGIFSAVVAVATLAYCLEGWTFSDAIYMVFITIFGVGYGEVEPVNTPLLRVTTILTIIAGPVATVYIIGALVKIITEKEFQKALADHRKLKTMDEMKRHTIICGFGRIGQTIARELVKAGQPFLVLDRDAERIAQSEGLGYLTLEGDAGDEDILARAHIDSARNLAAVLPNDMVNVFITLTARNMQPALRIIARAENPATEKKLRQAGANDVIMPAFAGGMQIAHRITRPSLAGVLDSDSSFLKNDLEELGVEIGETAIDAASHLAGQTLAAFVDGVKGRCIVLAIRHTDGTHSQHPAPHSPLVTGDRIISLIRKSA